MLPALKPLSSLKSLYLCPVSAAQSSRRPPAHSRRLRLGGAVTPSSCVFATVLRERLVQYHGLECPDSIIYLTFCRLRMATATGSTSVREQMGGRAASCAARGQRKAGRAGSRLR